MNVTTVMAQVNADTWVYASAEPHTQVNVGSVTLFCNDGDTVDKLIRALMEVRPRIAEPQARAAS